MEGLAIAGAPFLSWVMLVFPFTPGINQDSREATLDGWRRRPRWERIVGPFVWILERQQ